MTSYCQFMSYDLRWNYSLSTETEKNSLHLNGDGGFGEDVLDNSRLCHWFESFKLLRFKFR